MRERETDDYEAIHIYDRTKELKSLNVEWYRGNERETEDSTERGRFMLTLDSHDEIDIQLHHQSWG